MKKILSLLVVLVSFSMFVWANEPAPMPKKTGKAIETTLHISIRKDAKEARLIIPKSQLKQLRAELEDLDNEPDTTAAVSFSKTQTIVSGMFLSLAFVFGGVWLARSRKIDTKSGKALVIVSILFLSGAVATISLANAGPPPEARTITGKMFTDSVHMYKFGSGKIKLEVSDTEKEPELIVPDVPREKKPTDEE